MGSQNNGERCFWLPDCSARFYPIMSTKKAQSLFHICVELDEVADKGRLETALNEVLSRFPTYKVRLKAGYSNFKFVPIDARAKIFDFDGRILVPIDKKETGGYMFRVGVRGREIHLDMFHALTDGTGALGFMLALVRRYRELGGAIFADGTGVASVADTATEEECEDAFERYYKPIKLGEIDLKGMAGKSPHIRVGTLISEGRRSTRYEAESAALVKAAKAHGASFAEYFTGLVAMSIEQLSSDGKPFVMMIPVNLRRFFPSRTQRNFVLFARVVINPKQCSSLNDYVLEAKEQLARGVQKDRLLAQLSTTVKGMNNFVMRVTPLFVKKMFARLGRLFMRSRQTIIISNLGNIALDDGLGIENVHFNLNVSRNNVQNLAVLSFKGKTQCSFTSAIEESDLEAKLAENLAAEGVEIKLCSPTE